MNKKGRWIERRAALRTFHGSAADDPTFWSRVQRGDIRTRDQGGVRQFSLSDVRKWAAKERERVREMIRRIDRRFERSQAEAQDYLGLPAQGHGRAGQRGRGPRQHPKGSPEQASKVGNRLEGRRVYPE